MDYAAILDMEAALAFETCACMSEEQAKEFTQIAKAAGRTDLVSALDNLAVMRVRTRIYYQQVEERESARPE